MNKNFMPFLIVGMIFILLNVFPLANSLQIIPTLQEFEQETISSYGNENLDLYQLSLYSRTLYLYRTVIGSYFELRNNSIINMFLGFVVIFLGWKYNKN